MRTKIFFFALATFFIPSVSFASTFVGTVLFSDTTWTKENSPYVLKAYGFSVPQGVTLTIEPGTIVKIPQSNTTINIDGNLLAAGTETDQIFFTAINDSTLGGDTGYSPSGDSWSGFVVGKTGTINFSYVNINRTERALSNSGTAHINHTIFGNIVSNSGELYISHSIFEKGSFYALSHVAGTTTVISSDFRNDGSGVSASGAGTLILNDNTFEVTGMLGDFDFSNGLLFQHANNTATGIGMNGFFAHSNGSQNFSDQTWTKDNLPYVITPLNFIIPAGKTLTLSPGTVVKFAQNNASITVNGSLISQGTKKEPVVFTSLDDSTIGGNTAQRSPCPWYAYSWAGISLEKDSNATFDHTIFRNGGYFGGAIINSGGTLFVKNSEFAKSQNYGVYHLNGTTELSQNSFHHSSREAVKNYSASTTVLAKNNWWGSPTGPKHASNPEGKGEKVSDGVDFMPFLTGDPALAPAFSFSNITESEDDGLQDTKGVADKTSFTFSTDVAGDPDSVTLFADDTAYAVQKNGSTYTVSSTFPKGVHSWYFEAKSGSDTVRTEAKTFTTGYSNVAFFPGLEASRLYDAEWNIVWEPIMFVHDNSQLYMNPDGNPTHPGLVVGDVIDNSYKIPWKGNIYYSFIDQMSKIKNGGAIQKWETFPYDWRYSVSDTVTSAMIEKFRLLARSSDTGKVTIIAHSNGGLVAKELSLALGTEAPKLLDQMIFVASPQVGTPSAAGAILHGFQQGLPFDWAPSVITPTEARTLAQNMPSAYGLLPSAKYFTYTDDPVITFATTSDFLAPWVAAYGETIHSSERLRNFLTDQNRGSLPVTNNLNEPNIGNQMLFDKGGELHTALDIWTPPQGVRLVEIAGWGEDTLKTIEYVQGTKAECKTVASLRACNFEPVLQFNPKMTIDGDGTVVTSSALWTPGAEKYWVNLAKYTQDHSFQTVGGIFPFAHANIFEVDPLRDFLNNLIIQKSGPLPDYILTEAPIGNQNTKRLHFTLHSPLTLDFYDEFGNHTGVSTTTNQVEENILGSHYSIFGEVQYVSLPDTVNARLFLDGYESGSFTLNVESVSGDVVLSAASFAGIPNTSNTTATMNITAGGEITNLSSLVVDENGDGTLLYTLVPKVNETVLPDLNPPKEEPKNEPATTFSSAGGIVPLSFLSVPALPEAKQEAVSPSFPIRETFAFLPPLSSGTTTEKTFFVQKENKTVNDTIQEAPVVQVAASSSKSAKISPNDELASPLTSRARPVEILTVVLFVGIGWWITKKGK